MSIKPCTCTNEYQDQKHGRGMRVFTADGPKRTGSCTVCGAPHFRKNKVGRKVASITLAFETQGESIKRMITP